MPDSGGALSREASESTLAALRPSLSAPRSRGCAGPQRLSQALALTGARGDNPPSLIAVGTP